MKPQDLENLQNLGYELVKNGTSVWYINIYDNKFTIANQTSGKGQTGKLDKNLSATLMPVNASCRKKNLW